jgi:ribosome-binding factor A
MRRSSRKGRPGHHQAGEAELVDAFFSENQERTGERKLAQLCREVFRILAQAIPGDLADPVLDGVCVGEVRPAPDASRLAVAIHAPPGADARTVIERLTRLRGQLRSEIAAALQRKRTPELCFEVAP